MPGWPVPFPFSTRSGKGGDVGVETRAPIEFTDKPAFKFTDKIEKVVVELKDV